jgi:mannitol/fructose-specific phosphotransferase system IIA component (Ntr-type)
MNILDILSPAAIKAPMSATDKHEAINELVDVLAAAKLIERADELKRVVWERECQRSTGIGEGLAIPHGKCNCSDNLVMAIGRPAQPIDFDAVDKQPVRLLVLLASPPNKTSDHIQALGKISRLMTDSEFREAAYSAPTAEALYELFENSERQTA